MKQKMAFWAGLVLVNIISWFWYFRWDLTEEKRYSVSEATYGLLNSLESDVTIKVYLAGQDLPPGFKRLQESVEETLDIFKNTTNAKVNYQLVDLQAIKNPEAEVARLAELGVSPTNIVDAKGGRRIETIVYPWAEVIAAGHSYPVLLLKGTQGATAEEKLNQSVENLEYEFASAIKKLTQTERKKVGLLTEFTSLQPERFAGMINALQATYDVYNIQAAQSKVFEGVDAIIIPKPDRKLDDSTKYKLDQFAMKGGKLLFFVDGLKVDQIGLNGTYAQVLDLGIDDLLFKYGVKLNHNLVKDGQNAAMIPMNVGQDGNKPNIQLVPYRYYPLINNFGKSLITSNIDLVYTKFTSSLDTVKTHGIIKTPLLKTSAYTKVLAAPALVAYNETRTETEAAEYAAGEKTVAMLLEGQFQSLYKNRIFETDPGFKEFVDHGSTQIMVCADGDVIVNDLDRRNGQPLPLGFDGASNHIFGNQDFFMNAVDFLIDQNGVIAARGKNIKLRPLDKIKARENRWLYQAVNLLVPVLFFVLLYLIYQWRIKRKYTFNSKLS